MAEFAKMGLLLGMFWALWIQIVCSQDVLFLKFDTQRQNNGESSSYVSAIDVSGRVKSFRLSTGASQVSMANCTANTQSFTLQKRPPLGETVNVKFSNVKVSCSSGGQNILGLGDSKTSLAYQITTASHLPYIFTYCIGTQDPGELRFGEKGPYRVYYNTDILNGTHLSMHYFPLSYDSFFGNYKLQLNTVSVGSNTVSVNSVILINVDIRYTSLPHPAYDAVRNHFLREVASKKLKKDSAFGELDLCYMMNAKQMAGFSNVTLGFGGEKWVVSPDNYLAIKRTGVACFGFIDASHLPRGIAVIGTLMQENNFVEYDVKEGKLGVSGSLAGNLGLICSSVYAS